MFPILHVLELPLGRIVLHTYGACVALGVLVGWYTLGTSRAPRRAYLYATLAGVAAGAVGAAATTGHGIGEVGFAMSAWMLAALGVVALRGSSSEDAARVVGATFLVAAFEGVGAWLAGSRFGACSGDALARWAGVYPRWSGELEGQGSPAWAAHSEAGWIGPDALASLPTHVITLYEAAFALLLALAVRRTPSRRVRGAAVLAYGAGLAGLEALREHRFDHTDHGLVVGLILAAALAATGARYIWSRPSTDSD